MIKRLICFSLCLFSVQAAPKAYIKNIVNKTTSVLYELIIPKEGNFRALIFPNESKDLGRWVELHVESPLYVAALKGDGESIFLQAGPEASGTCSNNENLPQSMIMYTGQQRPPSNQKIYFKYCGKGDTPMEFDLIILPDGTPQLVGKEGVESTREF